MTEKQVVESTIELASGGSAISYAITAQDDQENPIGSTQISATGTGVLWNAFVWGDGSLWKSATNRPTVRNVEWTAPLVFKKMAILINASSTTALAIGTFFARYQDCGYTNREIL